MKLKSDGIKYFIGMPRRCVFDINVKQNTHTVSISDGAGYVLEIPADDLKRLLSNRKKKD